MAKKRPFFKQTYNLKHRSEWIKLMENVPEKPKSVGQFTGAHDKNGVEIYEGDIAKAEYGLGYGYENSEVYFRDCCYYLKDDEKIDRDMPLYGLLELKRAIEVIGNIHENPELLTESLTS